jgi:hypothetical protein
MWILAKPYYQREKLIFDPFNAISALAAAQPGVLAFFFQYLCQHYNLLRS